MSEPGTPNNEPEVSSSPTKETLDEAEKAAKLASAKKRVRLKIEKRCDLQLSCLIYLRNRIYINVFLLLFMIFYCYCFIN